MPHEPASTSGKKVKLVLTIFLSRNQAEKLTARAIREGLESRRADPED